MTGVRYNLAKLFTGVKDENINNSRGHNYPITGRSVHPTEFICPMI